MNKDLSMSMDADKFNEMLLELMLQSTAETRALRSMLSVYLSNGNDDAEKIMTESFVV